MLGMKFIWQIIAIGFTIAEAATLSLTMIWFSIGAVCALIASYFTDNIFVQILIFAVISTILLIIATKKLIKMDRTGDKKWANIKTNYNAVVGKRGFVTKTITPKETGLVKVRGEEWTAIAPDDKTTIKKDTEVVVKSVEGVKLIVEKVEV